MAFDPFGEEPPWPSKKIWRPWKCTPRDTTQNPDLDAGVLFRDHRDCGCGYAPRDGARRVSVEISAIVVRAGSLPRRFVQDQDRNVLRLRRGKIVMRMD